MQFFQLAQTDKVIIIVALCVLAVGLFGAVVAIARTLKKYKYTTKTERKKMEGSNQEVAAEDYLEEMEMQGDSYVLARNVIYNVGANGQIEEGSYVLRSAIEGETEFSVRYNGLVREVSDSTEIVLGEGDSIACVSHSMLITKQ